jgi:hypothetical protein
MLPHLMTLVVRCKQCTEESFPTAAGTYSISGDTSIIGLTTAVRRCRIDVRAASLTVQISALLALLRWMLWQSVVCVLVGLLWGCTNPLVKRGAALVEQRLQAVRCPGRYTSTVLHLTTPSFIIPQTANLAGSILFASQLGSSKLTVTVPFSNGIALAANAVVDACCGSAYNLMYLLPGLGLVVLGFFLCT